jgi:hypothetical protein
VVMWYYHSTIGPLIFLIPGVSCRPITKQLMRSRMNEKMHHLLRRRRVTLLSLVSVGALAISACAGGTASTESAPAETTETSSAEASVTAADTFSAEVCETKDPAAVADIPASVSGFTGYDSEPGDWLTCWKANRCIRNGSWATIFLGCRWTLGRAS